MRCIIQHDSGPECVPTIVNPNFPDGNYIMFASATSGDRPNNHNFSMCSIGNMTLVSSLSVPALILLSVLCLCCSRCHNFLSLAVISSLFCAVSFLFHVQQFCSVRGYALDNIILVRPVHWLGGPQTVLDGEFQQENVPGRKIVRAKNYK